MGDLFNLEPKSALAGPVECLGITFPNDEERRKHFLGILREKLKDPEFRKIEGFPIGSDEDILALSDPPYYTACPNPFLVDFIKHYGKPYDPSEPYSREPFAADVSEGKNDPIYNAHSYHTKVPHKAIMRYILHYTEPGDVVFDGFCGTGMTGVAAQLCGDSTAVEALGYRVGADGAIYDSNGEAISALGARTPILIDLSPVATFISYNYNTPVDEDAYRNEAKRILSKVEAQYGWMYKTRHSDGITDGKINCVVWSDVFICSECAREVVAWEAAVDTDAGKISDNFPCPHCKSQLAKRNLERAWGTSFDQSLGRAIRIAKRVPVLIVYKTGGKRFRKTPDDLDLALIDQIESLVTPHWHPTQRMPDGDESRRNDSTGLTNVHHFYSARNLHVLSLLRDECANSRLARPLLYQLDSLIIRQSKLTRFLASYFFHGGGGWIGTPLSGTLYVPSFSVEVQPFETWSNRISKTLARIPERVPSSAVCSTGSSSELSIPSAAVDYIFVDPPFGGNLMYSELNYLWEAWLKVLTNNKTEAIANRTQHKDLPEYQGLISACFSEFYRVLKPGRWITVEFHNSKNTVWNAIQEALQHAGFVVADVRTLDKMQGSFKQVSSGGAVKQDLIISAYKPNGGLERRFSLDAGTAEGIWDFVRTHLKQLPVFVTNDNQAEVIAERQSYLLFDRAVAFHVQRGVTVPISAGDFYAGLAQRFPERDGMYFLSDQVAEYDKKRMTVKEIAALTLFVIDEASAIQWLKQQLTKKPQTFQEIQPQFMQETHGGLLKHEKTMELQELLEQNVLRYDGVEEVPSQLHSYLSSNFKELRNLSKSDPALRAKGKDRWYVPDPNKAGDLEKLRERSLLKEFEEYRASGQKRLKVFRLEAVRAGFKKAWQERDYATIISVARKVPENVLQEDPKLLMWYDQAITRTDRDE